MNMYFKQKISAILPWAIAASLALAPAPMLLMLVLYRFVKKYPDWQKVYQYLMIGSCHCQLYAECLYPHQRPDEEGHCLPDAELLRQSDFEKSLKISPLDLNIRRGILGVKWSLGVNVGVHDDSETLN